MGECIQHSKVGHLLTNCPVWPKSGDSLVDGVLMGQNLECIFNNNICLSVQTYLCLDNGALSLFALILSGVEDFLDQELAVQAGLQLEELEKPISAHALDACLLAKVTYRASPLSILMSCNHHETIVFSVISASRKPLIFGFPWLRLHNPQMTGPLVQWVEFPLPCLPSVCFIPSGCCQKCLSALSHLTYLMYPLPITTSVKDFRYINECMATGIIRPSLPLGPSFLSCLVEKKDKALHCIDYRGLNYITVKNKYPLLVLTFACEPLQGTTIFLKLNLCNP